MPRSITADETTRDSILQAALAVFARQGAAGARTEEIARTAGVNKALLYYYFKDKDALHAAVLEHAMAEGTPRLFAAIEGPGSPSDRLRAYVETHFDLASARPFFAKLIQYELLRADEDGGQHLSLLVERYHRPLQLRLQRLITDGIAAGEFRAVDPRSTVGSIIGLIVFPFLSAPVTRILAGHDPFAPEALAARKAAIWDFIAHSLFVPARPDSISERTTR